MVQQKWVIIEALLEGPNELDRGISGKHGQALTRLNDELVGRIAAERAEDLHIELEHQRITAETSWALVNLWDIRRTIVFSTLAAIQAPGAGAPQRDCGRFVEVAQKSSEKLFQISKSIEVDKIRILEKRLGTIAQEVQEFIQSLNHKWGYRYEPNTHS